MLTLVVRGLGRRGRLSGAVARRRRPEPDRTRARGRPRSHSDTGAGRGQAGRRGTSVLHPGLRLRLHSLARRDARAVAARDAASRGRRASDLALPAAGGRGDVHPDGGGGHGQHRASGWAAQEVFPIAGDGARFPSLRAEGWVPWQPQSFFRRAFFDPERASMRFSIGGVDALSGRSMLQIAMQSRSQHRSQDMGMLQPLGARQAGCRVGGRRRWSRVDRPVLGRGHSARGDRRAAARG